MIKAMTRPQKPGVPGAKKAATLPSCAPPFRKPPPPNPFPNGSMRLGSRGVVRLLSSYHPFEIVAAGMRDSD